MKITDILVTNISLVKQGVAESLEEAVGDNYLYHATQPAGIMHILRTGVIKASYRPQAATKSRTQHPTVSTTRSKQYAESEDFVDFLNLTNEGNSVIIVFNHNAVANHYKMFSTSQGTQTVGDEFEEVIVVPKGAMPIQGTMKGFYFNPRRTKELEEYKEIPWFKELYNSPYYMGQRQRVAKDLNKMDKSTPEPGRDGRVSHSTNGSRDKKGSDYFKGKEAPGKPVTAKQMAKDARGILKNRGVAESFDYEREPLYHATLKAFEPSIMKSGLLPGGNLRMFDWSDSKYVYLSNYPDIARDFVDPGVIEPDQAHEEQIFKLMKQGGVILKIDQNKLNRQLLSADPHFNVDEDDGAETYIYSGVIPPSAIIGKQYFSINESKQGVAEGKEKNKNKKFKKNDVTEGVIDFVKRYTGFAWGKMGDIVRGSVVADYLEKYSYHTEQKLEKIRKSKFRLQNIDLQTAEKYRSFTDQNSDSGNVIDIDKMDSARSRAITYNSLIKNPPVLDSNGKIWDGNHRIQRAIELKLEKIPVLLKISENQIFKQGVAEGSEQISIKVRKGRSKFATELSVNGKPAGVYQYDANSGRSIAEVYPEYKGKGFGKILVLHAIYTAAKLGMDFVEDESRTAEYDNVLDSLDSNGLAINDDGYWYVTGEGEHFLKQRLKQGVAKGQEKNYQVNEGVNDPAIFKAIFVIGGPGSGKSYIGRQLGLHALGYTNINSDVAFEYLLKKHQLDPKMPPEQKSQRDIIRQRAKAITGDKSQLAIEGRLGLMIDGTGDDFEKLSKIKTNLDLLGYNNYLVVVNTNLEVARQRNQKRERSVPDKIVVDKWYGVQNNIGRFSQIFENFSIIDNSGDMSNTNEQIQKTYKMIMKFTNKPPNKPSALQWIKSKSNQTNLKELRYKGNLGIMELIKFFKLYPHLKQDYLNIKQQDGAEVALNWVLKKMNTQLEPIL